MSARRETSPSPERSRLGKLLLYWGPTVLALLVSIPSLWGEFVLDDVALIAADQGLADFDLERIFGQNYWGERRLDPNYRPLTLLTYALNHRLGSDPAGFHAVNVFLYALVVLVFHRLCLRLFPGAAFAFFAAALYAVFPIHIEAVFNVVGRAELLAALAIFGAWILVQGAASGEGRWRPIVAAVIVFGGMFCKENVAVSVAVIPLAVLLTRRVVAWRTAVFCALAVLAYLLCRELALQKPLELIREAGGRAARPIDNPLAHTDDLTRVVNGVRILGLYALKTVAPIRLSADYSFDAIPVLSLGEFRIWIRALAVLVLTAAVIGGFRKRAPLVVLGVLFFLAAFGATSNVVFPIGTIFAERLAFTPSAGLAIALAAAGLARSRDGPGGSDKPFAFTPAVLLLSSLLGIYFVRAVVRGQDWLDRDTLYILTAEQSPGSARAHRLAAEGHLRIGLASRDPAEKRRRDKLCEDEIGDALRILPTYPGAMAFWGEFLVKRNRFKEAAPILTRAKEEYASERLPEPGVLNRLLGRAHVGLGVGLGKGAEAREHFSAGLEALNVYLDKNPDGDSAALALEYRAIAHQELGDSEAARRDLDAAIDRSPSRIGLYKNRGYLRSITADPAGAAEDYRKGLELCLQRKRIRTPPGENAHHFCLLLFELYLSTGDRDAAEREREALRQTADGEQMKSIEKRFRDKFPR